MGIKNCFLFEESLKECRRVYSPDLRYAGSALSFANKKEGGKKKIKTFYPPSTPSLRLVVERDAERSNGRVSKLCEHLPFYKLPSFCIS